MMVKRLLLVLALSGVLCSGCGATSGDSDIIQVNYTEETDGAGTYVYDYKINRNTGEVEYVIDVSTIVDEGDIQRGTYVFDNKYMLKDLCSLYDAGVMDSAWASIYCDNIGDICLDRTDEIIAKKEDMTEDDWVAIEYDEEDLNKDGVVLIGESISRNINLMKEELIDEAEESSNRGTVYNHELDESAQRECWKPRHRD